MAPLEINISEFHGILVDLFSEEDLRTVCDIHLGIDYDSLPGKGKSGKAREIIKHMRKTERNGELISILAAMRPRAVKLETGRLGQLLGIKPSEPDEVDLVGERAFRVALAGQSDETAWLRKIIFIMLGVQAVVLLVLLGVAVLG
jgi:hypothetical protein